MVIVGGPMTTGRWDILPGGIGFRLFNDERVISFEPKYPAVTAPPAASVIRNHLLRQMEGGL